MMKINRSESKMCLYWLLISSFILFCLEKSAAFSLYVQRHPAFSTALQTAPASNNEISGPNPLPKKTKKTKGFTVNTNLVGSVSSDGILTDRRKDQPARAASTSLGVPTKKRKQKEPSNKPLSKKDRQRTANGAVDSSLQMLVADPENDKVQVLEVKRGSKTVTIIRGMTSPMDDRKKLLKEMKRSLGVGGTLVDGVLEIQGPHADKVLATLKKKGYVKAKKV